MEAAGGLQGGAAGCRSPVSHPRLRDQPSCWSSADVSGRARAPLSQLRRLSPWRQPDRGPPPHRLGGLEAPRGLPHPSAGDRARSGDAAVSTRVDTVISTGPSSPARHPDSRAWQPCSRPQLDGHSRRGRARSCFHKPRNSSNHTLLGRTAGGGPARWAARATATPVLCPAFKGGNKKEDRGAAFREGARNASECGRAGPGFTRDLGRRAAGRGSSAGWASFMVIYGRGAAGPMARRSEVSVFTRPVNNCQTRANSLWPGADGPSIIRQLRAGGGACQGPRAAGLAARLAGGPGAFTPGCPVVPPGRGWTIPLAVWAQPRLLCSSVSSYSSPGSSGCPPGRSCVLNFGITLNKNA